MKWSWKIAELAGIDVRIHATMLLLFGWIGVSYWMAGKRADLFAALVFIAAVFACVVLHEMGHALAARKFGIGTRDITLLPIGGLARLERMPEEPKQELWIALAGPAVNVAIAALLYGWLSFEHVWEPVNRLRVATGPFFERLLLVNISLVLFNLVPAFPMDGGRVLRALLARRVSFPSATQIAARVGQAIAVAFAVIGLFTSPLLILIALFVWFAARQEAAVVQTRFMLSDTPARAAMLSGFEILEPYDVLGDALRLTLRGSQHDFPVLDKGRVIGMLMRADLLAGLALHGPDQPVTSLMRRDFPSVQFHETLDSVIQRLQEGDSETLPLLQDGRLIGLLTLDNLNEYLLIKSILRRRAVRGGGRAAGEAAPV